MGVCFVPDCKHNSMRENCKFFRFPKNDKVRKLWIKNIRREDSEPSKNSFVCQCHFKNGAKENGPTIFARNDKKVLLFESPEKIQRKKRKSVTPVPSIPPTSPKLSTFSAEKIEIDILQQEIEKLKKENEMLKRQKFGFFAVENDESLINYYTGLPNKNIFNLIFEICNESLVSYYEGWNVVAIERKDQFFLTLMKLKLNHGNTDLSVRFNISTTTVSNVFLTWLNCLHDVLYEPLMSIVPSQAKNELCLPLCFEGFKNCRMVVDCTEFMVERPKKLGDQRLFYSSYKNRHTMKSLVGVAPNGVITYVSNLYPGSTSDKEVFKNASIINIFLPGDLILADKGFLITDVVPDGVSVNIPPFLSACQFTPSQVSDTTRIAKARIHVERAIRRIKVFRITRLFNKSIFPHSSKIVKVLVALTNFQPPLLKEVQHLYFK